MADAASGPLAGYRVVDLTANVLGPLATQLLGDAGAEVIKIEAPGGDPMRHVGPMRSPGMGAMFANLNRNKQSLVLDLKVAAQRARLLEIIGEADIFVHTIRPGAARRLGLGYDMLGPDHPRLIYASASGFKRGTSAQDMPAFDDTIQGLSGLASLNRDKDGALRFLPTIIADKFCGHVLAHAITLAALHRERTGEGQEVQVPMMDTMTAFNLIEHLWGATICAPEQGLGYTRLLTPNRRPYATKDGYLCVMAVNDTQWERLFPAIGRADLLADPRHAKLHDRAQNIDAVLGHLSEAMATRTTAQWAEILTNADIPFSAANSLQDLMVDPYLRESGLLRAVEHPSEGPMIQLAPTTQFSRSPLSIRSLAPRLDEHGKGQAAAPESAA